MPSQPDGPRLTLLGRLFILTFMAACAYGAWQLFSRPQTSPSPSQPAEKSGAATPAPSEAPGKPAHGVTVRISYGTEKKRWLEWAVTEFARTPEGRGITVELIPQGSLEGARSVVSGKERIHVWSPASSAYKNVFLQEWQLAQGNSDAIVREEALALTPMIFVFWKERYDAFLSKYREVSFDTIGTALQEPAGWSGIASKPEWGFFKYGHSDPSQSNSGLLGLVLYAQHYHKKNASLAMADVMDAGFNQWLRGFARNVAGMSNSTGTMMRDMVLKGPASYDCLLVYESVAIDYLKNAEGRWGALQVAYPTHNIWNDNPYYIINAPWSTVEDRKAADAFLNYLLGEAAQKQALVHGFRPAEPNVSLKNADSPFILHANQGLRIEIPSICEAPKADALTNLLVGWQRARE
ncbi:MAG: extracellular solute-binding protein [Verrucomicrobium sp.]|nr:extracellular solute-binding protein [Verrucomicrobium sp.]